MAPAEIYVVRCREPKGTAPRDSSGPWRPVISKINLFLAGALLQSTISVGEHNDPGTPAP